jgi:hypothetical protein
MIRIDAYLAKDGTVFTDKQKCAIHDCMYLCPDCGGDGIVNYEYRIPYPQGIPVSAWFDDTIEIRQKTCKRCSGIGFVDLKPIELDPEYKKYLELKNKFEGKK